MMSASNMVRRSHTLIFTQTHHVVADVIIVEDDPYYFLQLAPYVLNAPASAPTSYSQSAHLASLEKTFLNIDVQGRVIRLDSFSKTVAPGSRLGWFTANPLFTERLLRASEVTTQTPSGWSQGIIIRLLDEWKLSGFLQWLHGLAAEYQTRRDWMCDGLATSFDVRPSTYDASFTAYLKGTETRLFTFVPPRAGMFVWTKVFLHENKQFQAMKGQLEEPELEYERMLWQDMADAKVLLSTGNFFLCVSRLFLRCAQLTADALWQAMGREGKIGQRRERDLLPFVVLDDLGKSSSFHVDPCCD